MFCVFTLLLFPLWRLSVPNICSCCCAACNKLLILLSDQLPPPSSFSKSSEKSHISPRRNHALQLHPMNFCLEDWDHWGTLSVSPRCWAAADWWRSHTGHSGQRAASYLTIPKTWHHHLVTNAHIQRTHTHTYALSHTHSWMRKRQRWTTIDDWGQGGKAAAKWKNECGVRGAEGGDACRVTGFRRGRRKWMKTQRRKSALLLNCSRVLVLGEQPCGIKLSKKLWKYERHNLFSFSGSPPSPRVAPTPLKILEYLFHSIHVGQSPAGLGRLQVQLDEQNNYLSKEEFK